MPRLNSLLDMLYGYDYNFEASLDIEDWQNFFRYCYVQHGLLPSEVVSIVATYKLIPVASVKELSQEVRTAGVMKTICEILPAIVAARQADKETAFAKAFQAYKKAS